MAKDNGQPLMVGPAQIVTGVKRHGGKTYIIIEIHHSNGVTRAMMDADQASEFAKNLMGQASGLAVVKQMPAKGPKHA